MSMRSTSKQLFNHVNVHSNMYFYTCTLRHFVRQKYTTAFEHDARLYIHAHKSTADAVSPERGIFRPPPRSHLGKTQANVACQCVGSATRCGHQLRVKPKVHEDGLRYNA